MAKLYKVVVQNKITTKCFNSKQAKEIINMYKNKNIEAKVIVYKDNVKIYDMISLDSVEYYMEVPTDGEESRS
jgi:hypothetical protein